MTVSTKPITATVKGDTVGLIEWLEVVGISVVELNVALSKASDELSNVDQNSFGPFILMLTVTVAAYDFLTVTVMPPPTWTRQDKTFLSCFVRVGSVNTIGDNSRLRWRQKISKLFLSSLKIQ